MIVDVWTIALAICVVAIPLYSVWEGDKAQRDVEAGRKSRIHTYYSIIWMLWLPTLFLMLIMYMGKIQFSDLSLGWSGNTNNWLGLLSLIGVCMYFVAILLITSKSEKLRSKIRKQLDYIAWMMPHNKRELGWFTGGVSTTAGICEELLFRGFLWLFLTPFLGVWPALLVSSLLFGIAHLYQGWEHVFRTGAVGVILGLTMWFSESLFIAIALHALIDIYGGLLAYIVLKDNNESQPYHGHLQQS